MWVSYAWYSCGTRADPGQEELSEDGFAAPPLSLFWAPSESFSEAVKHFSRNPCYDI